MQIINIFPKTLPFFTNSFNKANDVYVKIYETAQLTMFYVFDSVGSISLVKYPAECSLFYMIS
jgi:hypothetical protein